MSRSIERWVLPGYFALVIVAWIYDALIAYPITGNPLWVARIHGIYLSGLLAMGLMSMAMVLALRPAWLENPLGGLDKMYRLHKWIGISAVLAVLAHWLLKESSGVITDLVGRTDRPARELVLPFLTSSRSLAKDLGSWSFYAAVVMLLLTLWKKFPYHPWRLLHKIMPVLYLMMVFHAAALMPLNYWTGPSGVLLAILLVAGTFSALVALTQKIGATRQYNGHITGLKSYGPVLEVTCDAGPDWPGHIPGQFAFVRFDTLEGHHPFTIASAAEPGSHRVVFEIKALGDYTRTLSEKLHVGQPARIEGPYGRLDFRTGRSEATQVWVAGGVGITPFIAWLESLQPDASPESVTPTTATAPAPVLTGKPQDMPWNSIQMHYCVNHADKDPFAIRVRALCEKLPFLKLHIHDGHKGDRLDAHKLLGTLSKENPQLDVWICGPTGLANSLRQAIDSQHLTQASLHQEVFEMR